MAAPLAGSESFRLLADYGIPIVPQVAGGQH
jgi:hypothetical protein